jgi:curli biogenesis system outer membrane secretion channel CsgG
MIRRMLVLTLVSLARLAAITPVVAAQEAAARPAVAIADVAIVPGGWTLPPPQLSAAIVQMMVAELVSSQKFHVYDGQWLVPEAEIGRADPDRLRTAAAERHVDYLVLGSLTAFSTEQKGRRAGGVLPKPIFLGGFSRKQTLLKVSMTFRIVDVRTGEIVSSVSGEGIGTRKATSLGGLGVVHGIPLGLLSAASAPSARDAMLNEAIKQAVHGAALALSHTPLPAAGDK